MAFAASKHGALRRRCFTHRQSDQRRASKAFLPAPHLILCMCLALGLCAGVHASAEPLRLATWHAPLSRKGPGLLLRDILKGQDAQITAVLDGVVASRPDILVLTDVDYDAGHAALAAFQAKLAVAGHAMPHRFALRPNSGTATGLDLDGDRRLGGPRDAQGYGEFSGQGGMALLSRVPILDGALDLSTLLWRDVPNAQIHGAELSQEAAAIQRLSSVGHWAVPLDVTGGPLWILMYHATTPVFDGPEDRNGRRNHDETALWLAWLDGLLSIPPPKGRFALIGDANTDPAKGAGRKDALRRLLADRRFQDPRPTHPSRQGDAAADTVDWPEPDPGDMRVSYVLPPSDMQIIGSGVVWPPPETTAAPIPHKLVWIDVDPSR
ncbi:endonuclease/exonuclease/phosphatase family protein [Primorskyibacter marinus]|uniref:endonuclease/exonuclease/phosphatase family protein n=1 Tax=Primorskyibacter marinus TaxID=1977320 RepID=UPI001E51B585|nr:endonuclease/exonuclease/phosphatase family protein [Primorskyibacter marinus]